MEQVYYTVSVPIVAVLATQLKKYARPIGSFPQVEVQIKKLLESTTYL